MPGNGKVFISHAHEDNSRCAPLLSALAEWGVDYWFDTEQIRAGDLLRSGIQKAIFESDIFIRICTPAAQSSYYVELETGAFLGLKAREYKEGRRDQRVLINIILDAGYRSEPFDFASVWIDATDASQREWLALLRSALGIETAVAAVAYQRRLPIYMLIDCSGSMAGAPIEAMNEGIGLFYRELICYPRSVETVYFSIIAFGSGAYQLDLVPIVEFMPPVLTAGGVTSLGAALSLLNMSLDHDIVPNMPSQKGDYMPIVLVFTDGSPTDDWRSQALRLRHRKQGQPLEVVGFAIGPAADIDVLNQVCTSVFRAQNVTEALLRSLWRWVTNPEIPAIRPTS